MDTCSVLIVGAGPTGLMMACELARYGISFRIIDKKAEPTSATNAAGIHIRTLQILEHIGIVDKFLAAGQPVDTFLVNMDGKKLATIALSEADPYYKYILMLPQSITERLFIERLQELHHQVERSVELTEVKEEHDKIISTVRHANGKIEFIKTDWIIGCDGYHSTVREQLNIPMPGTDINQEFYIVDARMKTKYPANQVTALFNKGTLFGLFPLRDKNTDTRLFRVVANTNLVETKKLFNENEIKKLIYDRTNKQCEVTEILWASPFWIHSKLAACLHKGRGFIAGDAAHVHSPIGAQGMNTGIQDAYNLAWKLALVINKKASVHFLDSYQQERYPIIKKIVSFTYRFSQVGLSRNFIIIAIRNFFIKNIVAKSESIKKVLVKYMVQLGWNYRKSPIVDKETKTHQLMLQPGDLIVDVLLANQDHLFDYLRNTQHNLLLFTGQSPTEEVLRKIAVTYQWVTQNTDDVIKVYVVSNQKIELPNVINDVGYAIHQRYNVTMACMCLIRPDHYIGLFKAEMDYTLLQQYFNKIELHFG